MHTPWYVVSGPRDDVPRFGIKVRLCGPPHRHPHALSCGHSHGPCAGQDDVVQPVHTCLSGPCTHASRECTHASRPRRSASDEARRSARCPPRSTPSRLFRPRSFRLERACPLYVRMWTFVAKLRARGDQPGARPSYVRTSMGNAHVVQLSDCFSYITLSPPPVVEGRASVRVSDLVRTYWSGGGFHGLGWSCDAGPLGLHGVEACTFYVQRVVHVGPGLPECQVCWVSQACQCLCPLYVRTYENSRYVRTNCASCARLAAVPVAKVGPVAPVVPLPPLAPAAPVVLRTYVRRDVVGTHVPVAPRVCAQDATYLMRGMSRTTRGPLGSCGGGAREMYVRTHAQCCPSLPPLL